jgi:hypothetical protein
VFFFLTTPRGSKPQSNPNLIERRRRKKEDNRSKPFQLTTKVMKFLSDLFSRVSLLDIQIFRYSHRIFQERRESFTRLKYTSRRSSRSDSSFAIFVLLPSLGQDNSQRPVLSFLFDYLPTVSKHHN